MLVPTDSLNRLAVDIYPLLRRPLHGLVLLQYDAHQNHDYSIRYWRYV